PHVRLPPDPRTLAWPPSAGAGAPLPEGRPASGRALGCPAGRDRQRSADHSVAGKWLIGDSDRSRQLWVYPVVTTPRVNIKTRIQIRSGLRRMTPALLSGRLRPEALRP